MPDPTNKQTNKELYTALITAITELTCFGKSELLQRIVHNLKEADYTKSNQLEHNIFAPLFVYLLIKQYPEAMQGIIEDPSNNNLLKHLQSIKKWNAKEVDQALKTLEEIKKIDTLRLQNKSGK